MWYKVSRIEGNERIFWISYHFCSREYNAISYDYKINCGLIMPVNSFLWTQKSTIFKDKLHLWSYKFSSTTHENIREILALISQTDDINHQLSGFPHCWIILKKVLTLLHKSPFSPITLFFSVCRSKASKIGVWRCTLLRWQDDNAESKHGLSDMSAWQMIKRGGWELPWCRFNNLTREIVQGFSYSQVVSLECVSNVLC